MSSGVLEHESSAFSRGHEATSALGERGLWGQARTCCPCTPPSPRPGPQSLCLWVGGGLKHEQAGHLLGLSLPCKPFCTPELGPTQRAHWVIILILWTVSLEEIHPRPPDRRH